MRWQIGTDETVDGTESFKVRVFAIEMALVPAGTFYVGDGTTTNVYGQFRDGATNTPLQLTGEGTLTLGGTTAGNLANNNAATMDPADDFNDTTTQTLPLAFPKGFNAFYVMKYEISQKEYCDFLNTLTQAQQQTRVVDMITDELSSGHYVMLGQDITAVANRQVIKAGANPANGAPYTFGCDADADGNLNESNDGGWRACNYLNWMDFAAFADWAGLRPMTELEFEKACRGGNTAAVANEYAWGTATVAGSAYTLSNDGTANEGIATNYSVSAGNCSYATTDGSIDGPLRCGIFAANASSTGRMTAGAAYYGAMEMSGNVNEKSVSVGNATGRGFTGTHGDGVLTTATSYEGNATNSDWPGYNATYPTYGVYVATGSGGRGSSWADDVKFARVSDRYNTGYASANRFSFYGGRAVRTSP